MMLPLKKLSILLAVIMGCGLIIFSGCNQTEPTADPPPSEIPSEIKPDPPPPLEKKPPPQPENPRVKLQTNLGDIVVELNPQAAPVTVENFLRYVSEGFYQGVIFHRVIPDFMIQAGGFTAELQEKLPSYPPIVNEASNGLQNQRGALATARMGNDPDSTTSQFFINIVDNYRLDYSGSQDPGYAVFGKVVEGMDIADKIAAVETATIGFHNIEKNAIDYVDNVPVESVIIQETTLISK